MNKNNTVRKGKILSVAALAGVMLTGCSAYQKPSPDDQQSTATLVDQKMIQLSTSVQNSLNALVEIERGDAPARNLTNPIGTSIAGRAQSAPLAPIRVDTKYADGQSKESVAVVEQRLDTKINIVWNNDADRLLSILANKIGFSFEKVGYGIPQKVSVRARDQSVKNILGVVAGQVQGRADIKVDLPNKKIELIYR